MFDVHRIDEGFCGSGRSPNFYIRVCMYVSITYLLLTWVPTTYVPTYHTYKKRAPENRRPPKNAAQRNSTQLNSAQLNSEHNAVHRSSHNNSSADSNNSTMDQRCPILSSASKPLFFILAESISVSWSWKQQIEDITLRGTEKNERRGAKIAVTK